MRRFFIPVAAVRGNEVVIEGSDAHHVANVLRKGIGTRVEAIDGQNHLLQLEIKRIEKERILCGVVERTPISEEGPILRLFQAIPQKPAWEDILVRACELGVSEIIPILSQRTLYPKNIIGTKKERWEKIIAETAKKTGRASPPLLAGVAHWRDVPHLLHPESLKIMPWELEKERSLRSLLEQSSAPSAIDLLIGPEGGFSTNEATEAQSWGFHAVSLGNRILTTSTAVTATLANIAYTLET